MQFMVDYLCVRAARRLADGRYLELRGCKVIAANVYQLCKRVGVWFESCAETTSLVLRTTNVELSE